MAEARTLGGTAYTYETPPEAMGFTTHDDQGRGALVEVIIWLERKVEDAERGWEEAVQHHETTMSRLEDQTRRLEGAERKIDDLVGDAKIVDVPRGSHLA